MPQKVTIVPVSEDGTPLEADAFVDGPEELVRIIHFKIALNLVKDISTN